MEKSDGPKWRVLHTISIYLLYFALGLSINMYGPALVNTMQLLNTSTTSISWAFSLQCLCFGLAMILVVGPFARLTAELQLFISGMLSGISLIAAPWYSNVFVYTFLISINGFCDGYIDLQANAHVIKLWDGHSAKDSIAQGMHMMFALASMICPFMIQGFLVDIPSQGFHNQSFNHSNISSNFEPSDNSSFIMDVSSVRYAYGLVGLIISFAALPSCLLYFCLNEQLNMQNDNITDPNEGKGKDKKVAMKTQRILLTLMFFYFCFAVIVEALAATFLSAFVIKSLDWTVKNGARLSGCFMAGYGFGRVTSILLLIVLSSSSLLFIGVLFSFIGSFLLLFVEYYTKYFVFITVFVLGFGTSNCYVTMLLWVSEYLEMTEFISGLGTVGGSLGFMTICPLVGYLMEHVSYMWLPYVCVIASGLSFSCSAGMKILLNLNKPNVKMSPEEVGLKDTRSQEAEPS